MGLFERFDRKIESTVEEAFARVFGGSVEPADVEAMLCREAADSLQTLSGGHLLAPNEYVISLSAPDYEKMSADPNLTSDTFAKHLAGYLGDQGWQTYGEVVVRFDPSPALHSGQVRAHGVVNPDATAGTPSPTPPEASAPRPPDQANTPEPGVAPMSDNPTYRSGQGQGRPGDEYYDERYGRPEDARPAQDPRAGYDQSGYPPADPNYPPADPNYPPADPNYPPPRAYDQGGYPPSYEQRGYPGPGQPYEQGHRPAPGYGPPGQQGGYGAPPPDYGRPEGRPDPRPADNYPPRQPYPDQGGYDRGYPPPSYGQPDPYAAPDYGRYGEPPRADYSAPADYAAPAQPAQPDYGQDYAAPTGYGGYGQPQSEYRPQGAPIVVLQLDDGSGRTYQLREGANVVGRGQDAQFRLPDTGVSRRHLEIRWDGQIALLSDLNSTNGTTVNNAPVQEWQLADGDVIRLGHSEIVVRVH
jgi:hypothetical protein